MGKLKIKLLEEKEEEKFVIYAGKERNIPIEVEIVENEKTGFGGRKYSVKSVSLKVMGKVPVDNVFYSSRFKSPVAKVLSIWHKELGKLFHKSIPKKDVYLAISKSDLERIRALQEKVEKENEEAQRRMKEDTLLTFNVGKEMIAIPDMKYEAVVFIPNKNVDEMTETERQRYKKLCDAIVQFGDRKRYEIVHGRWPDMFIDARKYGEGEVYTLDELEKMFAHCILSYDKYIQELEKEREEGRLNYERKKEEALRKAKETGEDVLIRIVDFYDSGSERGIIVTREYATPDGKIIYKDIPSY